MISQPCSITMSSIFVTSLYLSQLSATSFSQKNSDIILKINFSCVTSVVSQNSSKIFGPETGVQQIHLMVIYDKSIVTPCYGCIGCRALQRPPYIVAIVV